ncbi:ROK family protein [Peptacetobacter sp.]|uniref:ROK family protein n=1 Tax=Peptacetobacter sp. TaxID=2991975 RepID=UPI00261D9F68|nr:ROK family protein [Peptacetobacter sp.]
MKKYVCIDIGGTSIKYGLVTRDGEIIDRNEMDTEALEKGGPGIVEKSKKITREYLEENDDIKGICISTAGMVDADEGKIVHAIEHIIPGYTGIEFKKEMEKEFNIPCEIENDVNCAGLGEAWLGAGKGSKTAVCMTIGTGIGGAVIIDGKIHNGCCNSAGEIGYTIIEDTPFQDLASTTSLVKKVARLKGMEFKDLNGKIIFEEAKKGDEICLSSLGEMIRILAIGISNAAYLLNPEVIILGGGIMAQEEFIRPRLDNELKKILVDRVYQNTKIEFAYMKNSAGMIGALRNFLNRHMEE